MGLTYQMKMKIPFDMADMNGHIKLPDVILLSLQVSGMQSIELGVSDKDVLEQYNLVWIITDYDIDVVRLPQFAEESQLNGSLDLQSSILLPPFYDL